jgi:cytochrome c oxidase assembly factor CtaG
VTVELEWSLDPSVDVGILALLGAYVWLCRRGLDRARRAVFLGAGLALVWLALESPLDGLADRALLSAHMLQHVLLGMAAPALMLLGLSPAMAEWLVHRVPGLRALTEPMPAMAVMPTVMIAWHAPALYGMALASEPLHVLQHLTLIGGGLLFWWPVLESTAARSLQRLGVRGRLGYLLMMVAPVGGIGLALLLAPEPVYAFYRAPASGPWTPLADQRLAGGLLLALGEGIIALAVLGLRLWRPAPRPTRRAWSC